jgi:hypothetical protein
VWTRGPVAMRTGPSCAREAGRSASDRGSRAPARHSLPRAAATRFSENMTNEERSGRPRCVKDGVDCSWYA